MLLVEVKYREAEIFHLSYFSREYDLRRPRDRERLRLQATKLILTTKFNIV